MRPWNNLRRNNCLLILPEVRIDNLQREDKSANIIPYNMRGGFRAVKDFIWLIKISYRRGIVLLKTALVILLNKVENKIGSIIIKTFTNWIKIPTANFAPGQRISRFFTKDFVQFQCY